ncbi:MICOS complex subunit Mic10-like [Mizuhopecten yessoensis]|uniref:MICOS complex subunit Mic10-like n=1 Tax=Mizuhopecten yessoensis TaxID=6573 RepID=UPI000B45F197|nr:MICOS complex subunit Mic10-like [Mizuhopecten yessoensis]
MAARSEDVIADKWDKCIVDTALKTISGATIGGILSLTRFGKTKGGTRWSLLFFTGVGFGMGLANCNNELKYPKLLKLKQDAGTS